MSNNKEYGLAYRFEDQSPSYTYGFEAGLIAESMKRKDLAISATVRVENETTLREMAKYHRYSIEIKPTKFEGWMNLQAKLINMDQAFSES